MVVEVSPCTVATSLGATRAIASAIAASGTTSPHGASTVWTSAPSRPRISVSNKPKRPKLITSTRSPGCTSETSAASMPARAVPSTKKVQRFWVPNKGRYSAITSFM